MRLLVISLSFIFIFSACKLDDNTIATVGDLKISKDEFKNQLSMKFGKKDSYKGVKEREKKKVLDKLILDKQKLNEAYRLGLDLDDKILKEYKIRKRSMLANIYYENMIVDSIVSDSLINDAFEKTKIEVNASHVLIAFKGARGSLSKRSKDEALKLARQVEQLVKKGHDINQLAVKYSDDRSKNQNKGNLGYFTWGQMVDEFQKVAFSLNKNKVSKPVLTDYGYHVIYVHDKRLNKNFNRNNIKKQKDEIKERLFNKNNKSAKQMWDEHKQKLNEQYNFVLLKENIAKFVENSIELNNIDSLSVQTVYGDQPFVLAEWDDGNCTTTDLIDKYLIRFGYDFSKIKDFFIDLKKIEGDVNIVASQIFVSQISEARGFLDEKDIRNKIESFLEQSLISLAEKKSISEKLGITDAELKKYYEENQSQFSYPDRMEMWEIYVTNEAKAKKVYSLAKSGEDFEKLMLTYTQDSREKKGKLGFVSQNMHGIVSENGFKAGPNKLVPPFKYNKGWVVLKTGDLVKAYIRSFEDAYKQVNQVVRTYKTREKRNEWEAYLKETYEPEINEELLAEI